jgi:hypothetical protein
MDQQADKSGYRESGEALTDRACVRCAHHTYEHHTDYVSTGFGHLCKRPQLGSTRDHVIGATIPNTKYAYEERAANEPDACGPEGKFWSQSGF